MNKVNLEHRMLVVGIDIAKAKFDCALMLESGKFKHKVQPNNPKGFEDLLSWVSSKVSDPSEEWLFVMEATGPYHECLAEFLYQKGHHVSILNPSLTKAFGVSLGLKAKTDAIDAKTLARYGLERTVPLWVPRSPEQKELESLLKRIDVLANDQQRELNRKEKLSVMNHPTPAVVKSVESTIEHFEEEIKTLKAQVKKLIDGDSSMKKNRELLQSIPGIGNDTASWLVALIQDSNHFQSVEQLVAFVGLNPTVHQSGASVKRKGTISRKGNPLWRKRLYMPTLCAIKNNPLISDFYHRLRNKGKQPMVAVVASMAKLLRIAFGIIKHQVPFNPDILIST